MYIQELLFLCHLKKNTVSGIVAKMFLGSFVWFQYNFNYLLTIYNKFCNIFKK